MLKPARNVKLISAMAMAMGVSYSHAAGFGVAQVQSWLGEPLNVNVTVIGTESNPGWYACISARIESLDGSVVFVPKIDVRKSSQRQSIQLTTHQNINEPVMNVVLKLGCELAVSRTYQILLDPVAFLPNVDTVAQSELSPAATSIQVTKPAAATERIDARKVKLRQPHTKKSRDTDANSTAIEAPSVKKAKPAPSNRLRLTLLEEPSKDTKNQKELPTPPKSMPAASVATAKPTADLPEPALNAGDLTNATQMAMIKSLQVEIDTLRNENNRIKLKGTSDIAALQSVRSELFSWLAGLGIILLMCLAAIMWLATRFISLKKTQNQSPWNDLSDESIYQPRRKLNDSLDEDTRETIAHALQRTRKDNIELEVNPIPSSENDDTARKLEDLERLRQLYERHSEMSARDTAIEKIPQTNYEAANEVANFEPISNGVIHNKVEEISDVMELVGAWMALHKPTEVLKLLEPFNHVETPDSPLPWLCLLDVYNSMNDQEKYEAIGKRLVALFNVKVVPWETRSAIGRANLANFPHVVNKILALWDSDDVEPYLASLLINDREGARVGFDLSIYRDIERLHVLAKDPSRPRDIDKLRNYKAGAILFAPPPGLDEEAEIPQADSNAEALPKLPKRTKYVSDYHYGGHYDGFSGEGSLNSKVETATANKVDEPIFNEPAISIPLDKPARVASRDKTAAFLMDEPDAVVDDSKLPEVSEETSAALISPITVKLKLAIAYQDIGDSEGAILLLEEVINEGSEEEAEQARLMLSLMGD
ncbi:MAG: FimV/HubP family polar landmark protein [Pseudomonadota bacterium]